MNATSDLTAALKNALPVVQALGRECMAKGDRANAACATLAVDLIHGKRPEYAARFVSQMLSRQSWYREGQPVIDELRRFL